MGVVVSDKNAAAAVTVVLSAYEIEWVRAVVMPARVFETKRTGTDHGSTDALQEAGAFDRAGGSCVCDHRGQSLGADCDHGFPELGPSGVLGAWSGAISALRRVMTRAACPPGPGSM